MPSVRLHVPQRCEARQAGPSALARAYHVVYPAGMSTVTEIKQAVSKLPQRKKLELVQWLHTQVDDRLNDEEMMSLAVEGARALDKREATYAKRKAR
jgi:hypothetical protein